MICHLLVWWGHSCVVSWKEQACMCISVLFSQLKKDQSSISMQRPGGHLTDDLLIKNWFPYWFTTKTWILLAAQYKCVFQTQKSIHMLWKKSTPCHLRLLRNFGCSSPLGKSVSPPIFGPFFSFSIPSRSHLKRPQLLQGFFGSLSREMALLPQGHLKNLLMASCQR